jgi:hypothetical protein
MSIAWEESGTKNNNNNSRVVEEEETQQFSSDPNINSGGNGGNGGGGAPLASSSSSVLYPDELNDRVHFKLNAAWRHLDHLVQLENHAGSLAAANVRVEAEQGIDECLYHLAGVNDALLQEVNTRLKLGIASNKVTLTTMNPELGKKGKDARDIIEEINNMINVETDARWLINDCHNQSEHRSMIGQALVMEGGVLQRASLIDPRRQRESLKDPKIVDIGMRRPNDGTPNANTRILAVDFLRESYESMDELQRTVRDKLQQYLNTHNI